MYITRHWSTYRRDPGEHLVSPPRAPNSGILILKELEPEDDDVCCWDAPCCLTVRSLPLPSNQFLSLYDNQREIMCKYLCIPVLDYPLSFNRYYVIAGDSKHQGKALACSSEDNMSESCFGPSIRDVDPKPFDHKDLYLQIEISKGTYDGTFCSKSIAQDGFPPGILRGRRGWTANASEGPPLGEAQGLNETLRLQLPDFNFSIAKKQSDSVVVGEWYCPFMFIREECRLKDQMKKTTFYKVTLEQSWREIYMLENYDEGNNERDFVTVDTTIERDVNYVIGIEASKDEGEVDDGFIWFRAYNDEAKKEVKVGLSSAVVDNMRWVQREGGWTSGGGGSVKLETVEKIEGDNRWSKFGCYMLVESFVFRRSDGIVLMKCDFNHTHQIRCKWV